MRRTTSTTTTWDDGSRRVVLRLLERTELTCRQVAAAVGVSPRTLRRWRRRARRGEPLSRPAGRRPRPVARELRQRAIRALFELGPRVGVAVLRATCREVPYRQLAQLKRRFVRALQRRYGWWRRRLKWLRAGAIWALDFTRPAKAKLGRGRGRLLHVRDLASGAELLVLPCRGERAGVVCAALAVLFLALGVPLVLKMDNGGAFRAKTTRALLDQHGVVSLFSPPYTPAYNGSCERGGGTLKERIAHLAEIAGHVDRWTEDDIARAVRQANTTARPWGANGPTPAERFGQRCSITPEEREAFLRTSEQEIENALKTCTEQSSRMPPCSRRAAIDRLAVQKALCEHGYLEFRRGRLSTPIQTWRAVAEK